MHNDIESIKARGDTSRLARALQDDYSRIAYFATESGEFNVKVAEWLLLGEIDKSFTSGLENLNKPGSWLPKPRSTSTNVKEANIQAANKKIELDVTQDIAVRCII